ncbi:fumarylacetoacetate hydrolase family protein, partial [Acinetobacter baumannii]
MTPGLADKKMPAQILATSNTRPLYWTPAQMVAHHTCGGCNLEAGDLFGSGTISTPDATGLGALLEITKGGKE